jgi:hypothetical protein
MDEQERHNWLVSVTGEDKVRGIARKVGVSHTQVQRWIREGIPPSRIAELTVRFGADPIEALVLSEWLEDEHVEHLNYQALVKYVPVQILAGELMHRASIYSKTRPDPLRKTTTGVQASVPHPTDINSRHAFRLTAR